MMLIDAVVYNSHPRYCYAVCYYCFDTAASTNTITILFHYYFIIDAIFAIFRYAIAFSLFSFISLRYAVSFAMPLIHAAMPFHAALLVFTPFSYA